MAGPVPDRLYKDPRWAISYYPVNSTEWLIAKQLLEAMESLLPPPRPNPPQAAQLHQPSNQARNDAVHEDPPYDQTIPAHRALANAENVVFDWRGGSETAQKVAVATNLASPPPQSLPAVACQKPNSNRGSIITGNPSPVVVTVPQVSLRSPIPTSTPALLPTAGLAISRATYELNCAIASSQFEKDANLRYAFIKKHGRPIWIIRQAAVVRVGGPEDVYQLYANAKASGDASMKREIKDFSPDADGFWSDTFNLTFMPPMGTFGLPKTKNEELVIIYSLTEAILNTVGVHDNENAGHMAHWKPDSEGKFQRWQVDVISSLILHTCIKIHKDGFQEPIFDRGIRDKVNPDLTFDERINCVIILLSKWKSLCETVMKGEKIIMFVAGPVAHYKATITNKDNNWKRKDALDKLNAQLDSFKSSKGRDAAILSSDTTPDGEPTPSSGLRKAKRARNEQSSRRSRKLAARAENQAQAQNQPHQQSRFAMVHVPPSPLHLQSSSPTRNAVPDMQTPSNASSGSVSGNSFNGMLTSDKRDPKLPPIGNFKVTPAPRPAPSPSGKSNTEEVTKDGE